MAMIEKVIVSDKSLIFDPAHKGDAGFDIIASSEPNIVGIKNELGFHSINYIEYDTNLKIEPDCGYHTLVLPRSSISKTNLILANSIGLIDNGYRGTIKLRFKYIPQPCDFMIYDCGLVVGINYSKIYQKGDKIGQLVFAKTLIPTINLSELSESDRGEGGFGSTGV